MSAALPVREGVAPSYLWLPPGDWPNMLAFLAVRFPHIAPAVWEERMRKGEVVDGAGACLHPVSPYQCGKRIFYYRELDTEIPVPFDAPILYRDEHILVADKPHFLPVIPSGRFLHETLLVRLKKETGLEHLTPIHRIDRETAGVVIFSHDPETRGAFQQLFRERVVDKEYQALAGTQPGMELPSIRRSRMIAGTPFFRMKEAEGSANSETHIELIEQRGGHALYRLRPVTGKKHQLRVHLAALGIPIVNDALYPELLADQDDFSRPLQLLAKSVSFRDPLTGKEHHFESLRTL